MKKTLLLWFLFSQFLWAQKELKHEVFFKTDAFDISDNERNKLLIFLSKIESIDIGKITIYGFTDDRGSVSYNLTLSQNRANTIKRIFSDNEFDESIISNVDGKGKILLKIVQEDAVSKARGLNRKVEIIITPVFSPKSDALPKSTSEILEGKIAVGDNILLENILFRTSYSYLLPESEKPLQEISKVLLQRKDVHFTIRGHVCCTHNGRDAIDRKTKKRNLSVARAKFIYDYLAWQGVDKKRMKYVGLQRKFPLGGEAKYDRRVEILVTRVEDPNASLP